MRYSVLLQKPRALVWENDCEEGYFKNNLFPLSIYLGLPATQPSSYFYQCYQNITSSYPNTVMALTETQDGSDALPHCSPPPAPREGWGNLSLVKGCISVIVAKNSAGTLQPNRVFSESDTNLNKEDIA